MGNCHVGSPCVLELSMRWEIVMLGVLVYWKFELIAECCVVLQENEEEWIDYEQEEEIDYSSLRVQNLQIRYVRDTAWSQGLGTCHLRNIHP